MSEFQGRVSCPQCNRGQMMISDWQTYRSVTCQICGCKMGELVPPPIRRPGLAVQVTQGRIIIEYIDLLLRHPNVLIFEIGTQQKYPEIGGYNSAGLLRLQASDRTPGADQSLLPATVKFTLPPGRWTALPESTGRYCVNVAYWQGGQTRADRTPIYGPGALPPASAVVN